MNNKKKQANRENAQKSTGPITDSGKAVVSQNARTHGLLSRHLIIVGESQEEFNQLMCELVDEFQPVGLVEHALVERIAIAFWRQRRLVLAESAEVSLHTQSYRTDFIDEPRSSRQFVEGGINQHNTPVLEEKELLIDDLHEQKNLWHGLYEAYEDAENLTFADFPQDEKNFFIEQLDVSPDEIDHYVTDEYDSWNDLFETYYLHYEQLIKLRQDRERHKLLMKSQGIPSKPDLLARYQTSLDNDLYKALKALRESQSWRNSKAVISATPVDGA